MKPTFITFFIFTTFLVGCGDSVPKVDDPHNIVINGEKMTQSDFLKKYCQVKRADETCIKVRQARQHDSTRGEIPDW